MRLVHGGVQYREYLNEEQRSQPGCSAGRMQLEFHHGLLVSCNSDSHNKSLRVSGDSPLSKPRDAREDLVRGLRPDERLGFLIVDVEEIANGAL